jgi:hypothetical protein
VTIARLSTGSALPTSRALERVLFASGVRAHADPVAVLARLESKLPRGALRGEKRYAAVHQLVRMAGIALWEREQEQIADTPGV